MRDIANVALRLVLLMVVAGLCLGVTNAVTEEPIRQQELIKAQELRQAVLSEAEDFQDLSVQEGGILSVYAGQAGGQTVGYVFEMSVNGFGGEMKLTVGIAQDQVVGVRIASHSETPGLGANADSDSFLSQYQGKGAGLSVIKAGTPAENEILAVTAATISSRAVTDAVNEAMDYYENHLK